LEVYIQRWHEREILGAGIAKKMQGRSEQHPCES